MHQPVGLPYWSVLSPVKFVSSVGQVINLVLCTCLTYSCSCSCCACARQDSTVMWEQAPPGVMDMAVGEHHALIRRAAIQHAGYESTTEVRDSAHMRCLALLQ